MYANINKAQNDETVRRQSKTSKLKKTGGKKSVRKGTKHVDMEQTNNGNENNNNNYDDTNNADNIPTHSIMQDSSTNNGKTRHINSSCICMNIVPIAISEKLTKYIQESTKSENTALKNELMFAHEIVHSVCCFVTPPPIPIPFQSGKKHVRCITA